ncbi:molybdenum cofactor biosynthesis protein MoaE [Qipengyuania sp. XHP0211]|uniref:molybdenum cofactor biosynthesis protein MoaE n=1 Tax=Qipengyuania sp. XHP0211 TaxID=3038079 RepID=UPI00241CA37B|nr:molybdenum cofactor biosynthesis protein MoaE [Qipengyuania sp. XHP0211]MDG5749764.1 molybdenum cofactor biosynthesis protein MoaE [Qipengyuania sp. XHP0211]
MARITIDTPLDVRLLDKGLSVGEALAAFNAAHGEAGGVVSFLGKVRPDGDVRALELSHYEPLTLPAMRELTETARDQFALDGALVWHRIGVMTPGEAIVLVATAARHRRDAFAAADYLMDHLKSAAWLWKREKRADGWHWIEPRGQDHEDIARWE